MKLDMIAWSYDSNPAEESRIDRNTASAANRPDSMA